MIPSKFSYFAPKTLSEALDMLDDNPGAKVLAGGQSLIPMIKLRFAEPEILIDLSGINEVKGIKEEKNELVIGAMTTENCLISSKVVNEKCPIISAAARNIADPQVRNLGTIGGDIAHGDPANDHPAVMVALGATFVIASKDGSRKVGAEDFFKGTYMTDLAENEILTQIVVPKFSGSTNFGYFKLKRKTGDYATAGSSVVMRLKKDKCEDIKIALTNVGSTPIRPKEAEDILRGTKMESDKINEAVERTMSACDPSEDLRGSVEYKRSMAGEMTRRAILTAAA